jgi:small subunit ribosomal protein S5
MEAPKTTQNKDMPAKPEYKPFGAENRRGSGARGQGGSPRFGGGGRFGDRRRQGGGRRDDAARKDEFDSKLLDLSRVSHTRAGGRRLRFRAIMVSGNKAGKIGLGVASGSDVAQAVEKATVQSKKNMIFVPMSGGTISHEVIAKVGPARVIVKPQKKGRGLMAGGVVRLLCQLAGIKDISSKVLGTTKNKLNNARATMKAFEYLRLQSTRTADGAAAETEAKESNSGAENKKEKAAAEKG